MNGYTKTNYVWWRDKKMNGTILLILTISLQIFAWLNIPFLTSIHSYTIGMLFGFYNPLFYIFIIYLSLVMISNNKMKIPNWFKLNKISYWLVVFSIIFIGVSFTFYQNKIGYTSIGKEPWNSFKKWFDEFTSSKNAWFPKNTNGGIVGAFLYSFIAMFVSGIGALIVSIILIIIVISYIITGSSIGFYKQIKQKRKSFNKKIIKNNPNIEKNLNNINKNKIQQTKINIDEENKKMGEKNAFLPFNDPFNK